MSITTASGDRLDLTAHTDGANKIDLSQKAVFVFCWHRPTTLPAAAAYLFSLKCDTAGAGQDGLNFGYDSGGGITSTQSINGSVASMLSFGSATLATGKNYALAFYANGITNPTHKSWYADLTVPDAAMTLDNTVTSVDGAPDTCAGTTVSYFNRNSATGANNRGTIGETAEFAVFYAPAGTAAPTDAELAALYNGGNGKPAYLAVPAGYTLLSHMPFAGPTNVATSPWYDTASGQEATATGSPTQTLTAIKGLPLAADYTGITVTDTTSLAGLWEFCKYVDFYPDRRLACVRDRFGTGNHLVAQATANMPVFCAGKAYSVTATTRDNTAHAGFGPTYPAFSQTAAGILRGSTAKATYTNGTSSWVFHFAKQTLGVGSAFLLYLQGGSLHIRIAAGGAVEVLLGGSTLTFSGAICQSSFHTMSVSISKPSGGSAGTATVTVRIDDETVGASQVTGSYSATNGYIQVCGDSTAGAIDAGNALRMKQIRYYTKAATDATHASWCSDFQTDYGTPTHKTNTVVSCASSTLESGASVTGSRGFTHYPKWDVWKSRLYNFSLGGFSEAMDYPLPSGAGTGTFAYNESVGDGTRTANFLAETSSPVRTVALIRTAFTTDFSGTLMGGSSGATRPVATSSHTNGSYFRAATKTAIEAIISAMPTSHKFIFIAQPGSNAIQANGITPTFPVECGYQFIVNLAGWSTLSQSRRKAVFIPPHPRTNGTGTTGIAEMATNRTAILAKLGSYFDAVIDYCSASWPLSNQYGNNSDLTNLSSVTLTATSITRVGKTATVTKNGHGYSTGDIIRVEGTTQTAYNGEWTITVTDANTFTYTGVCGNPTTPATGTSRLCKVYEAKSPCAHISTWYWSQVASEFNRQLGQYLDDSGGSMLSRTRVRARLARSR